MTVVASILAIAFFLVAFAVSGVVEKAREALKLTGAAGGAIRNKTLSDEEKEAIARQTGLSLLVVFWSISWRSVACVAAALIPIYGMVGLGLTSIAAVVQYLSRWDVIVVSTVVIIAGLVLLRTVSGSRGSKGDYSRLDRAVHRVAFFSPVVQMTAADVEEGLYGKTLDGIADRPPIFITSLPRAGTTVTLLALSSIQGVATHRYRDMPFVMAPLLWSRMSKPFSRDQGLRERAHGDGIQIGYDSPEAFEEVLWKHFWPHKYHPSRIELWDASDLNAEASEFFRRHFVKLIHLRCGGTGQYVSKNNANIARLDLIGTMFPDAQLVVPIRDPAEHAASMHRQHLNFCDRHARDPFTLRYMRDVGHLEFGQLHRPIAFPGYRAIQDKYEPADPNYWLSYWVCAYRYIEAKPQGLHFLNLESLGSQPQKTMIALCRAIGLDASSTDFSGHFKPLQNRAESGQYKPELLDEARALYVAMSSVTNP